MKILLALPLLIIGAFTVPVYAETQCYSTGKGPIMSCYQGNRRVTVRKPFQYQGDFYNYYGKKDGGYCYKNAYGNKRCMQEWKAQGLECFDSGQGIICD